MVLNAIWAFAGVVLGAGICFLAVLYATKRFQTQSIRQKNWNKRVELYVEVVRYFYELIASLLPLGEAMANDADVEEPLRKLKLSARTYNGYVNEYRGEIEVYLPEAIVEHILNAQVVTSSHNSSAEEVEMYWDTGSIDTTVKYLEKTIELIKKDMNVTW